MMTAEESKQKKSDMFMQKCFDMLDSVYPIFNDNLGPGWATQHHGIQGNGG